MKDRLIVKFSGVALACAVIAGCASQPSPPSAEVFNKSLADADTVAKGGDQERAIALYQQLAKADPTREEPWSRIAQIQFQQGHYGQAIVAAQEALQRDQSDRGAKSVLAVAGLRIATQSVGELRQDAALAGDAKTDAQALAKQLRDTLGEDDLFPPEPKTAKAPVKRRRYVHHWKHPATAAKTEAAATAAKADAPAVPAAAAKAEALAAPVKAEAQAAPAKASGNDPFSALR